MALTREKKSTVLETIKQDVRSAEIFALVAFKGTNVANLTHFRRRSREQSVTVRVVKNTLLCLALEQPQHEAIKGQVSGPLLLASCGDPVALAKVLVEFLADVESLKLRVGYMQDGQLNLSAMQELSKVPSRTESLAMLVTALQGPIRNFATALHQVPAGLARVLKAVADSSS